jgi:hypothetical protein
MVDFFLELGIINKGYANALGAYTYEGRNKKVGVVTNIKLDKFSFFDPQFEDFANQFFFLRQELLPVFAKNRFLTLPTR